MQGGGGWRQWVPHPHCFLLGAPRSWIVLFFSFSPLCPLSQVLDPALTWKYGNTFKSKRAVWGAVSSVEKLGYQAENYFFPSFSHLPDTLKLIFNFLYQLTHFVSLNCQSQSQVTFSLTQLQWANIPTPAHMFGLMKMTKQLILFAYAPYYSYLPFTCKSVEKLKHVLTLQSNSITMLDLSDKF